MKINFNVFCEIILLIIFNFTSNKPSVCKKEIIETYFLNSYMKPRITNLYLCPNIQSSCCSAFDQFTMYQLWHQQIKPKQIEYYKGLNLKFVNLRDTLEEFFSININPIIEKLNTTGSIKDKIKNKYLFLRESNLPKMLDTVNEMQVENSRFLIGLRRDFYCIICNFKNHKFFKIPEKEIVFSMKTCKQIAIKTIGFVTYLNLTINKDLMDLSRVLTNFSSNQGEKPLLIHNFDLIVKAVSKCKRVVSSNSKNFDKCKNYCQLFKLNSTNPAYEGFPQFLSDIAFQLRKFIQQYGYSKHQIKDSEENSEEQKVRILESKKQINKQKKLKRQQQKNKLSKGRILNQQQENQSNQQQGNQNNQQQGNQQQGNQSNQQDDNKNNKEQENKNNSEKEENKQKKEEEIPPNQDELLVTMSNTNTDSLFDQYREPHLEKLSIKHFTGMVANQEKYKKEKQKGYEDFVKNKLHYLDVEQEFENVDQDNYIKIITPNLVDLENYRSVIENIGINIYNVDDEAHLEQPIFYLMNNLKRTFYKPINYEKMDDQLVQLLNDLQDSDLEDFHKDNFMRFEDFGKKLTKRELLRIIKDKRNTYSLRKKGYAIK